MQVIFISLYQVKYLDNRLFPSLFKKEESGILKCMEIKNSICLALFFVMTAASVLSFLMKDCNLAVLFAFWASLAKCLKDW